MSEYPPDLPRLHTLRRYLLLQLAAVHRRIEAAETGRPAPEPGPPRWCITWRRTPKGEPRVGVLHSTDCMLAKGETVDARAVVAAERQPGRRLVACDTCRPRRP